MTANHPRTSKGFSSSMSPWGKGEGGRSSKKGYLRSLPLKVFCVTQRTLQLGVITLLLLDLTGTWDATLPSAYGGGQVKARNNRVGNKAVPKKAVEVDNKLDNMNKSEMEEAFLKSIDQGDVKMFLALLRQGVDVNIKDKDGMTPLMLVTKNGYKPAVQRLLERKDLDLNAKTPNGETALSIAKKYNFKEIAELLGARAKNGPAVQNFDPQPNPVKEPNKQQPSNPAKEPAEEPLDVQGIATPIDLALLGAVKSDDLEQAKLMIAQGANVNLKNLQGETLLVIAAKRGNPQMIQILMEKNAGDANVQNQQAANP